MDCALGLPLELSVSSTTAMVIARALPNCDSGAQLARTIVRIKTKVSMDGNFVRLNIVPSSKKIFYVDKYIT
jgi:hypothetical protein